MTAAWLGSDKSTPTTTNTAQHSPTRLGAQNHTRVQCVSSDALLHGPGAAQQTVFPIRAWQGWTRELCQGSPPDATFQETAVDCWTATSIWSQSSSLFGLCLPCLWVAPGGGTFLGLRAAKASHEAHCCCLYKSTPKDPWSCSSIFRWGLLSQDRHNQVSHTGQFKTAEMYSLELWRLSSEIWVSAGPRLL